MNRDRITGGRTGGWSLAFAGLLCLAACNRPAYLGQAAAPSAENSAGSPARADDVVITSLVRAALLSQLDIDGKAIAVSTRQGQVTLTGSIPARQIELAEEIVRSVDGVRDVDNRLRPAGILA